MTIKETEDLLNLLYRKHDKIDDDIYIVYLNDSNYQYKTIFDKKHELTIDKTFKFCSVIGKIIICEDECGDNYIFEGGTGNLIKMGDKESKVRVFEIKSAGACVICDKSEDINTLTIYDSHLGESIYTGKVLECKVSPAETNIPLAFIEETTGNLIALTKNKTLKPVHDVVMESYENAEYKKSAQGFYKVDFFGKRINLNKFGQYYAGVDICGKG